MNINVQKVTSILILAFAIVISGCGDDNPMGTDTGDGDNEAQIPEAYQNLPGTIIAEDETWSLSLIHI